MPTPRSFRLVTLGATALAIVAASFVIVGRGRALGPARQDLVWTEAAWTMPLDNWGQGRAWRAVGPGGAAIRLFARTKSGFCNCFNGIADDVEIDRIGDVDLHGDNFQPLAPGEETAIGDLKGRERAFQISGHWGSARQVLSIVAASDCKAVVATLVSDQAILREARISAVALLSSEPFRRWAADQ